MFKKPVIVLLTVFIMASIGNAEEIGGIAMPDSLAAGQARLILNGAGLRTKFFMSLYVGGLYLAQKNVDAGRVVEADEPMAIRLHIISSHITSEKMETATREGFEKSTNGNTAPVKAQIENFITVFKDKINENDIYDFVYIPNRGLEIYKNAKLKSLIEGLAFKQALFGIWLSDKPAQKSLKEEMLGK